MTAPETTAERGPGVHWSAILAGAFVFFALLTLLATVGAALGLSLVPFESNQLPGRGATIVAAAIGSVGVLLAFYVAGYVAGLAAERNRRREAILQALLVWALIATLTGMAVGGRLVLVVGGLFAGRTASELLGDMNPRLVSDLKLTEGKVSSRVVTSPVPEGLLGAISELAKRRAEIAEDPALRDRVSTLRQWGAAASWWGLLVLVAGAASAALGAAVAVAGWRFAPPGRTRVRARVRRSEA